MAWKRPGIIKGQRNQHIYNRWAGLVLWSQLVSLENISVAVGRGVV